MRKMNIVWICGSQLEFAHNLVPAQDIRIDAKLHQISYHFGLKAWRWPQFWIFPADLTFLTWRNLWFLLYLIPMLHTKTCKFVKFVKLSQKMEISGPILSITDTAILRPPSWKPPFLPFCLSIVNVKRNKGANQSILSAFKIRIVPFDGFTYPFQLKICEKINFCNNEWRPSWILTQY